MREIRRLQPAAELRAWGGDLMAAAGAEIVKHYRDLAFMGFVEVVANLPTILRNIRRCKEDVLAFAPDVLVLIDYPGFNLRIARWAKKEGIRVVYYISPQIWAWHSSRVHNIKKSVDRMLVILPFEQEFYANYEFPVDFVGHPLLDVVAAKEAEPLPDRATDHEPGTKLVALLPGSRKQEIARMLAVMLAAAALRPAHTYALAMAPGQEESYYLNLLNELPTKPPRLILRSGATHDLLRRSDAALVTSGTATLETALFGVPEVVCYQAGNLSYQIARRLINVPYISLVNLVMDREIVTELIQSDLTPERLAAELDRLLQPDLQERFKEDYAELRHRLGDGGAAARAAALVCEGLRE